MRRLLLTGAMLTGAALALTTGLAAAQTTTSPSSQSTGANGNENAPAMPSGTETTPPQRNSTMDKTMDQKHPKPESGSSAMQNGGPNSKTSD